LLVRSVRDARFVERFRIRIVDDDRLSLKALCRAIWPPRTPAPSTVMRSMLLFDIEVSLSVILSSRLYPAGELSSHPHEVELAACAPRAPSRRPGRSVHRGLQQPRAG
jgi:hypothetical protein